jgi:hypothetical protein
MHETGIPNWGKQLVATATMRSPPTKTKTILSKCSGVLQPGQLTLVRSSPRIVHNRFGKIVWTEVSLGGVVVFCAHVDVPRSSLGRQGTESHH